MTAGAGHLKVALLAGTLGQGGAEKQLVMMARALTRAGVEVRVFSLTRGEFYESDLRRAGLPPIWSGRFGHPLLRLATLALSMAPFRPNVIQAAHAYVNLYAALLGRLFGAVSLGAMRNSLALSSAATGAWTRWLITSPTALLANSHAVCDEIQAAQLLPPERIWFVPNAIDVDQWSARRHSADQTPITAAFVGRLVAVKRLDCFLRALAKARQQTPALRGVVIGDGPERAPMEHLARELELMPQHVAFLGSRSDVASELRRAEMLVLTSDDEGSPNVLLEAMAAGLPVISTPAGDAKRIVHDGATGFLVPFDDPDAIAAKIVCLAGDAELRSTLGSSGRQFVDQQYSAATLTDRLLSIYHAVAERQHNERLRRVLAAYPRGVV